MLITDKDIIMNNAQKCRSSRIIESRAISCQAALRQHANYQFAMDYLLMKLQGQNRSNKPDEKNRRIIRRSRTA